MSTPQTALAIATPHDSRDEVNFAVVVLDPSSGHPTASARRSDDVPSSNGVACQRWKKAVKCVMTELQIARSFRTLRDMTGVNEIDPKELMLVKKLGEGAYAVVEECMYTPPGRQPVHVAVKRLKPHAVEHEGDLKSFCSEVSLMRKLEHPNIMRYIGIGCEDASSETRQKETMFVVTELMQGGTLKSRVMAQMTSPHKRLYTNNDALRWCIQIADALRYLHAAKPMVIHRDMKLDNILLTSKHHRPQQAKLADFGLAAFIARKVEEEAVRPSRTSSMLTRAASQQYEERWTATATQAIRRLETYGRANKGLFASSTLPRSRAHLTGQTGTLMYMAPEMFRRGEYNEKVDVFSFGVLMYEVFHRYLVFFAISHEGTEEEIVAYAERVSEGYRPPISDGWPPELRSLIADCWGQDPARRVSMAEVVERLRAIQQSGILPHESVHFGFGNCTGGCIVS